MKSFPITAVQSRFSEMTDYLFRHPGEVVELTYRDRAGESVLLILPRLWHARRESTPVDDGKILEPLSVAAARPQFGQLRKRAVYEGCHAPITSHGHENLVLVPLAWARQAGLWTEPEPPH